MGLGGQLGVHLFPDINTIIVTITFKDLLNIIVVTIINTIIYLYIIIIIIIIIIISVVVIFRVISVEYKWLLYSVLIVY